MPTVRLTKEVLTQIDRAVKHYVVDLQDYANLAEEVIKHFTNNESFKKIIHSSKFRTKDPEHLRDKLIREAKREKLNGKPFDISEKNVFTRIHDLAGVRFLHIHTKEIELIHPLVLEILRYYKYRLLLKPVAYTWDIENERIFKDAGFNTVLRESMYTSVHYVVEPHYSRKRCEIQVRTLMEELWGEVSHAINYPQETDSISCQEQLRALARIASGCTRLVDSIFTTYDYHNRSL